MTGPRFDPKLAPPSRSEAGMVGEVHHGRWTTDNAEEIVLFVVGIRANRLRAVRNWLPVLRSLRPMLDELTADPATGLLGHRSQFNGVRELIVFQYWQSVDQLMDFAHAPTHRKVWQEFYRSASRSLDVGIWHETFVVPAGRYEAIYGNVPQVGLGAFQPARPISRRRDSARARLGEDVPAEGSRRASGSRTAAGRQPAAGKEQVDRRASQ
ncbi:MAG TPA: DUF4188 domain-containing protein [Jatrophihabitans sp.]|nr:DUF4188 domain-containing protein [Jatrophihabitans sp.]